MTAEVLTKKYTLEEYHNLPDSERYELINGELVEMPPSGFEHGEILVTLGGYLKAYARQHDLGRVTGGSRYTIDEEKDTEPAPDVAFTIKGRIEGRVTGAGPVPPDLAVEIISPSDSLSAVYDKVQDYLQRGVRLVWAIFPAGMQVFVYRLNNSRVVLLNADDELDGLDVVPGFKLKVSALFE